jgi:hypothetical protein
MNNKNWVIIVAVVLALGTIGPVAFADIIKVTPITSTHLSVNPDPPFNLLLNGSFQTGDFTDWTLSGNVDGNTFVTGPFDGYVSQDATDGFFAALGAVGSDVIISQSFSDTSGQHYAFSFYYNANGTQPSDISAFWDGTLLLSLTNPLTSGYQHFTFLETGTGLDTVSFHARNDPDYDALDNVSVVSEPGSLLLLGSGLVGLGGTIRRKLRK